MTHNITFEAVRAGSTKHLNYNVLINGEKRAVFKNLMVYGRRGFSFRGADDSDIRTNRLHQSYGVSKAEFDQIVRDNLDRIPTVAQIEFGRQWMEAWNENRARDADESRHRAKVHKEMLIGALELYITNPELESAEHRAAAELELKRVTRNW